MLVLAGVLVVGRLWGGRAGRAKSPSGWPSFSLLLVALLVLGQV